MSLTPFYDVLRGNTFRILVQHEAMVNSPNYYQGYLTLKLITTYFQLNATFVWSDTPTKGIRNVTNGQWSGLLGYLQRDQVDIIAEPLVSGSPEHFDYLPPIRYARYRFSVAQAAYVVSDDDKTAADAGGNSSSSSFLSDVSISSTIAALDRIAVPFLYDSWLAILAALLFVAFQYLIFEFMHAKRQRHLTRSTSNRLGAHYKKNLFKGDESQIEAGGQSFSDSIKKFLRGTKRACGHFVIGVDQFLRPLLHQRPTLAPAVIASQAVISVWCVCCVILTAMYSAKLTAIFGAAPGFKSPFDNISSLEASNYVLLLDPGSPTEQIIRTMGQDLAGTPDEAAILRLLKRSEPHWDSQMAHYKDSLFGSPKKSSATGAAEKHFTLLSGVDLADKFQSKQCDLKPVKFFYPLTTNSQTLVELPERPMSFALQKNSRFTVALSQIIQAMNTHGLFSALRLQQWKKLMELKQTSNGEKYGCNLQRLGRRQRWKILTLRGLLPTFTLLLLCFTAACVLFVIERSTMSIATNPDS